MKSQSKSFGLRSKALSSFLRKTRISKNIRLSEIGKALGVGNQYISNYELNKCAVPLKHLKQISKVYGVPPDQIIDLILKETRQFLEKTLLTKNNSTSRQKR